MRALRRILSLAAALLLWSLASWLLGDTVIPTPAATARAGWALTLSGELPQAFIETLSVYLAGYAAAAAVGVSAGVLMGGIPALGRALDPYANALAATPRVAFIPLAIILLGLGFESKMFIVLLGASMPILLNTYAGVLQGDPELVEMARAAGANRAQIFRHVLLPGALPFIVVGLRLGATIGLINTVVAELYTAVQGLGGLLALYGNTFRMAPYFAVVLLLATLGVLVTQALRLLERRAARWRSIRE